MDQGPVADPCGLASSGRAGPGPLELCFGDMSDSVANDSPAAHVARAYVAALNAGNRDAIVGLFDDDAEWLGQLAAPHRGREALAELYEKLLGHVSGASDLRIGGQVTEGDASIIVIERRDRATGAWKVVALDHLELNEQGQISRISIYGPPRIE